MSVDDEKIVPAAETQAAAIQGELATELAKVLSLHEETQTATLTEHSKLLGEIKIAVVLVQERTKDLPALIARVGKLENWRWMVAGMALAFTSLGGILMYIVNIMRGR